MRRVAGVVLLGAAIAAAAVTAGAGEPTTHDVLPVIVTPRGNPAYEIVFGTDRLGPAPLPSLSAFRRPATDRDLLPASLQLFARAIQVDAARTRLLLSARGVRIYAFPGPSHELCYLRAPPVSGSSCTGAFLDGAFPLVTPWRDAWGLVDDDAVEVDVDGVRATLGQNAFYSRLPPKRAVPHRITVYERSGLRHVYDVRACPAPVFPFGLSGSLC